MNRIFKKSLAVMSSAAIMASMITVPAITASAANSASYSGGKLNVTSDKTVNADVYVASYNSDNTLKEVKKTSVALTAGENSVELAAEEGDKILVWDEKNTPIAGAVTVEAEKPSAEPTAPPTTDPTAPPSEDPTATPSEAPTADPDDDVKVIKSWKFDMGTAEEAAEGWTAVTTDMNYTLNNAGEDQFGFIGNNENDYKLPGGRIDGFVQQKGQVIELTAANGAIGSTGADKYGNAGDKYYPTRFALKVSDDTYYRVKATVTTLDSSKPATASLYTERKHPLYTDKTIAAGESITTEFRVRVTPIYYEKSDPKGTIKDEIVNVAVLGENTALASVEIDQIETTPTLWVIGDSTVTDGGGTLPYTPYVQCTGVGTGLTKYLPKDIAMVNVGEGGLNAADNNHFNIAKSRIKAGDYMYVEYGHNHKNDGVDGYKGCLDKYYDACKAVGATLILVGPIDRHNSSQYNAETNTWSSTLSGYSDAAKAYVDAKLAAGATDIAFVDLNKPCLDWLTTLTAKGTVNDTEYTNDIRFTNYYFATAKDGSTDGTHPNDSGAESLAYFFFSTADTEAYPALKPLMTAYKNENPTPVSAEVINMGWAGKSDAWPQYIAADLPALPVVVKGISFTEDGSVEKVDVYVQEAELKMDAYGIIVVTIYDEAGAEIGKLYATDQVDNSTGVGGQTISNFRGDVKLPENGSYSVQVWKAVDSENGLEVDAENIGYSGIYKKTDIDKVLITGDEGAEVETFNYFGASKLTDATTWKAGGSAGQDLALGTDDDGVSYATIGSDGAKNGAAGQGSFYVMRALENLDKGTSYHGKYMISVDAKYVSGGGLNFAFAKSTTPTKSPFVSDQFTAFTIGSNGNVTINGYEDKDGKPMAVGQVSALSWTNVTYILDMDAATAEISVGGGAPVTVPVPMYDTYNKPAIDNLAHFIMEGQKVAFNVNITNLTVAKLKDSKLGDKTVTINVADEQKTMGTVSINGEAVSTAAMKQGSDAVLKAEPAEKHIFVCWKDSAGQEISTEPELNIRAIADLSFTAEFAKQGGVSNVTSFKLVADKAKMGTGKANTVNFSVSDVFDAAGNPVEYDAATDITWSCDDENISVANGVATIPETYTSEEIIKTVTVTAAINGVERSYALKLYSSDYYEDFAEITDFSTWISNSGTANSLFDVIDTASDASFTGMTAAGNGKALVIGNGSNGSGKNLSYERDMGLSAYSKLKFGFEVELHQIRTDGKKASVVLKFVDTEGTEVFNIGFATGGGNSSFNGAEVNGFVKGVVVAVDTELDFEAKTMTYKLTTADGKELASGTAALTASNLAKMANTGDWQYGKFAIDNVYADYE